MKNEALSRRRSSTRDFLYPFYRNISLGIPCGSKFLRVLIFAVFPAIRKNKFPHIKITADIFPAKIYSRVNIL